MDRRIIAVLLIALAVSAGLIATAYYYGLFSQLSKKPSTCNGSSCPAIAGDFGTCTSLPQGWSCGNANCNGTANIVNRVFYSHQSNPGIGNDNSFCYAVTQKGTFPWTPCSAPAQGVLAMNLQNVSASFNITGFQPAGTYRYHVYIALYYWLPNGALSSGGSTYQCLDTQVRVENVNGTYSSIGTTATYNPGDSFGWDNVTAIVQPGQHGTLTANVANQCQRDLIAWSLPATTVCQLAGIEIGTEGFQFQLLDTTWSQVTLT